MQSKLTEFLSLSALAFALTACSGGGGSDSGSDIGTPDTGGGDQTGIRSATVDASSQSDYVYFNLTRGETVALTADEAAASQDWHLAFRRTNIKLNGGASGPGTVAGALLVAQDDFYDVDGDADANIFLNATPDSELEHLSGLLTPASRLVSDSISSALVGSGDMVGGQMDMGWYFYDLATHTLSLNDTTGWLLKSGEGNSYARFHATAFTYSTTDGLDVTFEFDVQPSGASVFETTATFTAQVASGESACFDFDGKQVTSCEDTDWDLQVGLASRSLYLRSNGGVSGSGKGAAFGPFLWDDLATDYPSGTADKDGNPIAFLYTADSTSGILTQESWYAYAVTGQPDDHKLYPNYRVYQVSVNSADPSAPNYAIQILSYYHLGTGASGHYSFRWRQLDAE